MVKNLMTNLILLLFLTSNINCFLNFNFKNSYKNKFLVKVKNNDASSYTYAKEYYDFLVKYNLLEDENYLLLSENNFYDRIIELRKDKYNIFVNNYLNIEKHNLNSNFKLGINQFADSIDFSNDYYPPDLMIHKIDKKTIYKNDFLSFFQILKKPFNYFKKYQNFEDQIIWTENDILSEVKDQKNCGSCWAFSSTGAIESKMRLKNFTIDRLSEQELVDCSKKNKGCNGGLMEYAFDYIIENKGLTSNKLYPYNATTSKCKICKNSTELIYERVYGSNFTEYEFTVPRSKLDLLASLNMGPVSIAIDANSFFFRFYKSGVIDIPSNYSTNLNHAVLLTGYSKDENGTYWIIQNSWGKSWGDNGYAKLRYIDGDGVLLCQVYGVYPLI